MNSGKYPPCKIQEPPETLLRTNGCECALILQTEPSFRKAQLIQK